MLPRRASTFIPAAHAWRTKMQNVKTADQKETDEITKFVATKLASEVSTKTRGNGIERVMAAGKRGTGAQQRVTINAHAYLDLSKYPWAQMTACGGIRCAICAKVAKLQLFPGYSRQHKWVDGVAYQKNYRADALASHEGTDRRSQAGRRPGLYHNKAADELRRKFPHLYSAIMGLPIGPAKSVRNTTATDHMKEHLMNVLAAVHTCAKELGSFEQMGRAVEHNAARGISTTGNAHTSADFISSVILPSVSDYFKNHIAEEMEVAQFGLWVSLWMNRAATSTG